MRRRLAAWGWVAVPAVWLLAAVAAVEPGAIRVRDWPYPTSSHLVYDPADLAAYALRGANAHAGRPPGRADEPVWAETPAEFDATLDGPTPGLADRFYLEYPPPVLGLFWLEAAAVGPPALPPAVADAQHTNVADHAPRTAAERAAWGRLGAAVRLHFALMAAALVALGLVLRAGYTPELRAGRAVWLLALPGAVYFSLMRYDVLLALATALAFRCVGRGRPGWAGAWLAAGVGLKLYPVLFLPVLLRLVGWRAGLRLVAGFAVALGLIAGACVWAVGVEGSLAPIRVQLDRPPELGSWTLYDRVLPAWLAYSPRWRLGLLALAVLACVFTRPATLAVALRRCGLVMLVFTHLAVFWSPQWLVWFLPLTVPLAGRDRRTGWAAAAVDLTNYLSFPVLFHVGWVKLPGGRETAAEVLIGVRTLAWAWLGWRLLRGERRPRLPAAGFRTEELADAVVPPRGLRWLGASRHGAPVLQGRLALQPVLVWFEPVPGGGLEDVPQAREPRPAVAVFAWDGRRWSPTGKLAFNLTAEQLARQLGEPGA